MITHLEPDILECEVKWALGRITTNKASGDDGMPVELLPYVPQACRHVTHLEPDILECEVKWALGSITMNKASGGDGMPVELFQILKDAVKVLHSVCQQIWKPRQCPQEWKGLFSLQPHRKAMSKNVQTITQLHSFHMLAK